MKLDPDTPTITQHPGEVATLLSGTSTLVTDNNGFGYFTLTYPSSEAQWVTIELTATAQDGLAQNKGIETFTLPVAIDDINTAENQPPGGSVSPYGQATVCTDKN